MYFIINLFKKIEQQTSLITTWAPPYSHFRTCPPFRQRMMSWKFRDNIIDSSGVTVLTDRQTNKHTNRRYWKQYHLAAHVVNTNATGAFFPVRAYSWVKQRHTIGYYIVIYCYAQYTPLTRLNSTVASRRRRRCVLNSSAKFFINNAVTMLWLPADAGIIAFFILLLTAYILTS